MAPILAGGGIAVLTAAICCTDPAMKTPDLWRPAATSGDTRAGNPADFLPNSPSNGSGRPVAADTGIATTGPVNRLPGIGSGKRSVAAATAKAAVLSEPQRPLALEKIDVDGLDLNEEQRLAMEQVGDMFANMVGNDEPAAGDTAGLERWESARRRADDLLRARLGEAAMARIQDDLRKQRPGRAGL